MSTCHGKSGASVYREASQPLRRRPTKAVMTGIRAEARPGIAAHVREEPRTHLGVGGKLIISAVEALEAVCRCEVLQSATNAQVKSHQPTSSGSLPALAGLAQLRTAPALAVSAIVVQHVMV